MKVEEVKEPIFNQRFLLYTECDFDTFYRTVTGEKFEGDSTLFRGHCINTQYAETCIWVKDRKDIPTLAHELLHATQFALFERCWVNHKEAETPAYYLGFLMREFLEKEQSK